MNVSVNHEWSEDGECSVEVEQDLPCWRFSFWDIAGIAVGTVGGIISVVGNGFGFISREFQAAAQFRRSQYDEARERFEAEEARAEMAGALEGMVYFDGGSES